MILGDWLVWIHKPGKLAHFYVWSLENLRRGLLLNFHHTNEIPAS